MLPGSYALLSGHYYARHNAKADLGKDKPVPVNLLVQQWIDNLDQRVDQAGPQHRRNQAAQENRAAGKHREHRAKEKSDE